ncbi:hypothetical protein MRB53_021049 [Persea americana]|uniref:Uncharacterized protein n=1 Tax=Persea americana TaxID=3435 RepID=A0ACC2L306_PERAE|nr:hypothetical protein MRB53_021049 [Persea americana]
MLTEVLSLDGNMKNAVAISPLAVNNIMFYILSSNGALWMECIEGHGALWMECIEDPFFVPRSNQFRILFYQLLSNIALYKAVLHVSMQ